MLSPVNNCLLTQHMVPNIALAMTALPRRKITSSRDSTGQCAINMLLVPISTVTPPKISILSLTAISADQISNPTPCPLTRKTFLDTVQYLEVAHFDVFVAAAHLCLIECAIPDSDQNRHVFTYVQVFLWTHLEGGR